MFESPLLTNNSLVLTFEVRPDLRKLATQIEDLVCTKENSFTQPTLIPVPDEIEPSMPRIIFNTKHSFSQLVLSQNNITLNMMYSSDFQSDTQKCEDYINRHAPLLYKVVEKIIKRPVRFTGLASVMNVHAKTTDENIIKRISELYNVKADGVFDLDLKFTYVIDNKYFQNLKVQNYRGYDSNFHNNQNLVPMPTKGAKVRGIQVALDFNDRYSFNETKKYQGDWPKCSSLIVRSFNHLKNEMNKFKK